MEKIGDIEIRVTGKSGNRNGILKDADGKNKAYIPQPKFDKDYLNSLIKKANKSWKNINPDEWLSNLRGGYEA